MKNQASFSIILLLSFLNTNACVQATALTSIPIPTHTPELTPSYTPTAMVYPVKGYDVLPSPDGTTKAVYDAYLSRTFLVMEANDTVLWSITYDSKFDIDAPEPWYKPFQWSKDGKFLYYTCFHGQESDGSAKFYGNEFIDGCGVFRLNVRTGETIDILPEIAPMHGYYAFSLSPDEKYLVYTYQAAMPVQIILLDMSTGDEQILLTADEAILETGRFGWSPRGDELVFMALKIAEGETRLYSIYTLDLNSLETELIIDNFDTRIRYVSWQDDGIISYKPDTGGVIWQLSIDSKTFSISTMTPPAEFMSTPTP